MTTETLTVPTQDTVDRDERQRIVEVAIERFGQHGFDVEPSAIAEAAGMSTERVGSLFGSTDSLRKACEEHILTTIRTAKSEALQSMSPTTWFAELATIESYAPMMAYLVRSMLHGGALGRGLMRQMIDNAEQYLDEAVRAGSIKPSRDPKARAKFLSISNGGGFLLYLNLHENPTDMAAVLRDYGREMVLPALELYTDGLMTDAGMYEAFLAREAAD